MTDQLEENERLRDENIELDKEIQEYESAVIAYEKTIATLREGFKECETVRDYNNEQVIVYKNEVDRLKAMRLCPVCICKNYHDKDCKCREPSQQNAT